MQQPTIDPGRLDALQTISHREKSAMQAAQDEVSAKMDRAATLRRDIQNIQRQIDRAPGENLAKRLVALKADQKRLDKKIEEANYQAEIARERYVCCSRLAKNCADFLSNQQEASR
ncbi:hypothetical protein G6L97_00765 [Agrobacterium tumefaciens]|uniref:hypothetical protein n=1 Tax=Agrobacterium tumefaciens TaxID=358 RepID=UPI0015723229|nr:hypothetical protein [Agrobacterium tumefaciens]NSZ82938.1 hypothetical protein [Agrobacterium tumefaciens]WCA69171.1 hypothetical protein G6L97_00765 [Agrobacterium tumefaciens]